MIENSDSDMGVDCIGLGWAPIMGTQMILEREFNRTKFTVRYSTDTMIRRTGPLPSSRNNGSKI